VLNNPSVVILGGGLSGVAAAYTLAEAGLQNVTLIERGETLGGLAGSFERDGSFYPLGYHHILHRDRALLFFLERIGALGDVRWRRVRMLFHLDGAHYDLGSLSGFLRFPMPFRDKVAFVRLMVRAFQKREWSDWLGQSAADLIDHWGSPGVRTAIFERLSRIKFELPCEKVSAAWLGARLHYREGSAPLGYIPGANWTKVLCDGLTKLLLDRGVEVRLLTSVNRLHTASDCVTEAETDGGERIAGNVFVSTVPTEIFLRMVPTDRTPNFASIKYSALISVICATRQTVEPEFYWMNVVSEGHAACGIFVLNSLNPSIGRPGDTCINFVIHLQDRHRPLYSVSDEELLSTLLRDFRSVLGFELDPFWVNITRIPMYSPVFFSDFRNPPIRSASWNNVYFAGNYRTFPSIVSTGTALGSGVDAARAVLRECDKRTDLVEGIRRFRLRTMPRGKRRP
jgi:protoporphyrinogen oxidase